MNYKMNLMYDGSRFNGFSPQPHKNTVQDELECKLSELFKQKIFVIGASRTDSKVHALDQWVIFEAKNNIAPSRVTKALNVIINKAILIKRCEYNNNDFHPRYMAKNKTYQYIITHNQSPFTNNYKTYHKEELNVALMQEACQFFVGTKDFTSCCASNTHVVNKVRTINYLTVKLENKDIIIEINGNGFLYNMVRIIVGNLMYVGSGRIKPNEITGILESRNRCNSGITAEPQGLYLKEIIY